MDQAFLEDLAPGQVFTSDARAVVDAGAIKRFASEFDPQPFHLDEASARPTFFKKLVASGWHTTAVTMQLLVRTLPLSHGMGLIGMFLGTLAGAGDLCARGAEPSLVIMTPELFGRSPAAWLTATSGQYFMA